MMKVVALVHFYPPWRLAGSETMLHVMLRHLVAQGHEAVAVTTDTPSAPAEYVHDGVRGISVRGDGTSGSRKRQAADAVKAERPDVIVSHHQNTELAIATAKSIGARSVFMMHNDFDANLRLLSLGPDAVVFNSDWIAAKHPDVARSMVVHPPVWANEHATEPGDAITLVNLNAHKGGLIFYDIARRMPDRRFIGVIGGHGHQNLLAVDNVELVGHTDDMPGDVWSQTRILLMPSIYESYGLCAIEAAASGIPTIAHPTPGLRESLGDAGIFVDRTDVDGWVHAIRDLDDKRRWTAASKRARRRSKVLDPTSELDNWVHVLEELIS